MGLIAFKTNPDRSETKALTIGTVLLTKTWENVENCTGKTGKKEGVSKWKLGGSSVQK